MASESDQCSDDYSYETDDSSDAENDLDISHMTSSSHSGNLVSSIQLLRSEDSFCDVTIKCRNFEMKAHKNVLASATDYFKAMFLNETKESKSGIVDFSEMLPEIVKQCIQFIYSGRLEISKKYAKDLLDASEMMQLSELSKLCVEFLAKKLTLKTCAEILTLANIYQKKPLDFPIADFLMKNFEEFIKTEDFKSLDLDSLTYCLNLLQDGSREHEILKWNGILAWIGFDASGRSCELDKLLSVVEWAYLSKDFVFEKICNNPLVKESVNCLQFLTKVAFGSKELTADRKNQTQPAAMLAFNRESRLLFRYGLKSKTWTKITRYPARLPNRCDVIFYKGLLCVGNGKCLRIFSNSKWKTISQFSTPLQQQSNEGYHSHKLQVTSSSFTFKAAPVKTSLASNVSDDSVYCRCFGLSDYVYMMTSEVLHRYHIPSSTSFKKSLSIQLSDGFFCALSHDTIYAMGGEWNSRQVVEINYQDQTCRPLSSLITQKERGHAFWYHEKLFAFGGQYPAAIECYSPDIDQWCVVKDMIKISKHPTKVHVLGDQLYLVGGEYGEDMEHLSVGELKRVETPRRPHVDMSTACSF